MQRPPFNLFYRRRLSLIATKPGII
ncbi:hypothetical protein AB1N83_006012 [Pleurotus pulmonarius]